MRQSGKLINVFISYLLKHDTVPCKNNEYIK